MKKKTILIWAIIILVVSAMCSLMIPMQKKVLYTARLTKVEYGGLAEDDHYYFSNGKIENGVVMHDVEIGGLYRVAGFYDVYGITRIFTKAYLISA